MIDEKELQSFIKSGKDSNYKIMLLLFDWEDNDYYPVYFNSEDELDNYNNNIISETKCRIEEVYDLLLY